jgi:hypothetical protein
MSYSEQVKLICELTAKDEPIEVIEKNASLTLDHLSLRLLYTDQKIKQEVQRRSNLISKTV